MARPTPIPDPLTEPYWQAVAAEKFVLPRCAACGRWHFYPRPACPHCGDTAIAWTAASGRGTVYSHSVVHRAPSPAFAEDVPYVIAVIATDEGPHLLSRVVEIDPAAVRIGMRVRVRFGRAGDGPVLPLFAPDSAASA